jgi:hypothetical protein
MGPRAGVDSFKEEKIFAFVGILTLNCPACSKLLFWLRYHSSSLSNESNVITQVSTVVYNIVDIFIKSIWNRQQHSECKGAVIVCGSYVHQKEVLTCHILFHSVIISFMYHFWCLHYWGGSILCLKQWDSVRSRSNDYNWDGHFHITKLTKVKILFIVSEGTVGRKKINIGKQQLQGSFQGVTFI